MDHRVKPGDDEGNASLFDIVGYERGAHALCENGIPVTCLGWGEATLVRLAQIEPRGGNLT